MPGIGKSARHRYEVMRTVRGREVPFCPDDHFYLGVPDLRRVFYLGFPNLRRVFYLGLLDQEFRLAALLLRTHMGCIGRHYWPCLPTSPSAKNIHVISQC